MLKSLLKTAHIPVSFREEEREALQCAAEADDRALSALARKIVVDWLKENGYLKGAAK